ncbi:MAG: molybdopterin-guanine dinucleotide biosynthesis protein B [Turicibacter sp.]|nr:molybdopterin-guanine dinucleotide biosynthesis protein B [Turicibacter sp.]MDO5793916.1 molybdopterin-guanine dinucleotide biosynthesis protein B [Turicibacter sp.]
MAKVVNIIGQGSNVGKTVLMEGLIKELRSRGLTVATVKHDVHGFDIDHKGKDTYRHREAGANTVVISSKNRFAMIKEVDEEMELINILQLLKDKDIILVEGYKKSPLRKIEVYRDGVSDCIMTKEELLIAVASDAVLDLKNVLVVKSNNYIKFADLVEKEKEFEFKK